MSAPPWRPAGALLWVGDAFDPDVPEPVVVDAGVVLDSSDVVVVCEGGEDVSCVVEPVPPALQPASINPINITIAAKSPDIYFRFSDIISSPQDSYFSKGKYRIY